MEILPIQQRWVKQCDHCRGIGRGSQNRWREANPELAKERSRESAESWRENYPERYAFVVKHAKQMKFDSDDERKAYYRAAYRRYVTMLRKDPARYAIFKAKHNERQKALYARKTAKEQKKFKRRRSDEHYRRMARIKDAGEYEDFKEERAAYQRQRRLDLKANGDYGEVLEKRRAYKQKRAALGLPN